MSSVIRFSDAVTLALHGCIYMAGREDKRVSVKEIADSLEVSSAHLSKVLATLSRKGLVISVRGPQGGYQLSKPGERINLLEVFEAIEGPLGSSGCPLDRGRVSDNACPLTGFINKVNDLARKYMTDTSLSDFRDKTKCHRIG